MAKSKSSKHVKASKGGIDRISNLPDPLISHILSFLPTKCAVATSILSSRWKFLWTSISNLDFCSLEYDPQKRLSLLFQLKSKKFTLFVNRVLHLLNPPSVQNFRLKCYQDCFDPSYLHTWISAGFGRTFKEFELSLTLRNRVVLPLSHVDCNVVVLKLDGDIDFNIPATASVCFPSLQALHLHRIKYIIDSNASASFPNLKIMHLNCVKFVNDGSIHKLLLSCPVLDDLIIERDGYDDVGCLIICIPSLTRLSIECRYLDYDTMYKLQIECPALQYLHLFGGSYCVHAPAENLSSVLHANVKIDFFDDNNVNVERCINIIKFLRSLSNVQFLSVSSDVPKAFRIASTNSSPGGFHNLTRLEIKLADCLDFSVVINNLLENMDNLEHLVIKGVGCSCSPQSRWAEPLNVPKCLLSRVTTVSFSYMRDDCCDQLELLSYFLKNAEVLQLLTICSAPFNAEGKQLEMLKKISLIPRRSRTCQVAFS